MTEIMTLEEVARYLRVSERTVIEWVQKGEVPGGKLGTSWRFKRSEIENWVNKRLMPRLQPDSRSSLSLTSLITPERTALITANSKNEALNQLIDMCITVPGINNRKELADAIFTRESLMSTGIGLSIAVPHARLNTVKNVYMAFAINDKPIMDYQSLDGIPVRIIVMIIAGRDQHAQYLLTLSLVSSMLKNQKKRDHIMQSKTAEELITILVNEAKNI